MTDYIDVEVVDDNRDKKAKPAPPPASNYKSFSISFPYPFLTGAALVSAYTAFNDAALAHIDTADKAVAACITAAGTCAGAKILQPLGHIAGKYTGLAVGGYSGALAGGIVTAMASEKRYKIHNFKVGAVFGSAGGATMGRVLFGIMGSFAGFWGGAVGGHHIANNIAANTFADPQQKKQTQEVTTGEISHYQNTIEPYEP